MTRPANAHPDLETRLAAILAASALLLTLALHVATFFYVDPLEWIQPQWLAVVLFYALLAAVLILAHLAESRRERRARRDGVILANENPTWFKPIVWALVAYALVNFFMAAFVDARKGDVSRLADGTLVADPGHGRPVVSISADEYHRLRRLSVRRITGFMLMVYGAITADLLFTLTGRKQPGAAGTARRIAFFVVMRRRTP
jgi:hypothetical protein